MFTDDEAKELEARPPKGAFYNLTAVHMPTRGVLNSLKENPITPRIVLKSFEEYLKMTPT